MNWNVEQFTNEVEHWAAPNELVILSEARTCFLWRTARTGESNQGAISIASKIRGF